MATKRPSGLGVRGRAMWAESAALLGPANQSVLEEACRTADRLDFLHLTIARDPANDEAVAAARSLAGALRLLVRDVVTATASSDIPGPTPAAERSVTDDLKAKRAERVAAAKA